MLRKYLMPLLCALLVAGLFGCAAQQAGEVEEREPTSEQLYEVAAPAEEQAALTWKVEPAFAHENVYFCSLCGFYSHSNWMRLDEITGAETADFKGGHGGRPEMLLYDESLNLFGLLTGYWWGELNFLPENEFTANAPQFADSLNLFHSVDTTRVTYINGVDGPRSYDISQALIGRKAIAVGTDFVTGFDFDSGEWHPNRSGTDGFVGYNYYSFHSIVAVRQGNNWGIFDSAGNTLVPFVLEHAITIDNHTAFAKYGGLYGILQVREPDYYAPVQVVHLEQAELEQGQSSPIDFPHFDNAADEIAHIISLSEFSGWSESAQSLGSDYTYTTWENPIIGLRYRFDPYAEHERERSFFGVRPPVEHSQSGAGTVFVALEFSSSLSFGILEVDGAQWARARADTDLERFRESNRLHFEQRYQGRDMIEVMENYRRNREHQEEQAAAEGWPHRRFYGILDVEEADFWPVRHLVGGFYFDGYHINISPSEFWLGETYLYFQVAPNTAWVIHISSSEQYGTQVKERHLARFESMIG